MRGLHSSAKDARAVVREIGSVMPPSCGLPRVRRECYELHMTKESLHRVVALIDAGSNPFELGCAIEVFGLHRPELGRDLYDFRLCSATRTTRMRDGFFDLTG